MPTTGMTRSFAGIVSDPRIDVRVRRALDRLCQPFLVVTNEAPYLDDQGRVALRLHGTSLSQTVDGLRVNPSGSPVIAGLTITGYTGFLYAANGVVSAVNNVSTTLNSSVTQTGNTAATETDLFTYTVPAATLSATGDSLEFIASGTFAGTASVNKKILVYFGGTTVYDSGNLNITSASSWSLRGSVLRTGATTQKCSVTINTSSATLVAYAVYVTSAETLADPIVLRVRGNGTNANDVVGEFWKVVKVPA